MIVFSAVQALSPAIERTRRILFMPFRWWTFFKLCAVAVFTEGFGGNFNFSTPSAPTTPPSTRTSFATTNPIPFHLTPVAIGAIIAASALFFVIGILLFYLITRLRFALFYCLTYQVTEIRPGWRLYREPANRFFALNLAVALIFVGLVVLAAAPFAFGFYHMLTETPAGAHFDVLLMLSLFLPVLALLAVIGLVAFAVDIVLRDFMLPHFALEDRTARGAWAEVWARIRAEKGPFFLYGVLRVVLPIAAMMAIALALTIPTLLVFGILALIFHSMHVVLPNIEHLYVILLAVVVAISASFALLLAICFGGPLSIWVRSFALVFYGGRYPLLGNVLFPEPPPFSAPGDNPAT